MIIHRPGLKHANADGLSRQPCRQCGLVSASEMTTETSKNSELPREESHVRISRTQPSMTHEVIREAQLNDPSMAWILEALEKTANRPDWEEVALKSLTVKTYWTRWKQLQVLSGTLYLKWETEDGKDIHWFLLLPKSLRGEVIEELHGGKWTPRFQKNICSSEVTLFLVWHEGRCSLQYKEM